MPRTARNLIHAPGALVHVIIRFVDGRFVVGPEERDRYLRLLERAMRRSDWTLLAYAVMSTHIHLFLLIGEQTLLSWIGPMHVRFAQWINKRVRAKNPKALGHVIADRPKTHLRCATLARIVIAYLHRNPPQAGVGADAAGSDWTSHRAYLGTAEPRGVDVAMGLRLSGYDPSPAGRAAFAAFVERTPVEWEDLDLDEEPTRSKPGAVSPMPRPGDIVRCAVAVLGYQAHAAPSARSREAAALRRVAIVAGLQHGFTAREMAAALSISESGVSRLLSRPHDAARVEDEAARVLAALEQRSSAA